MRYRHALSVVLDESGGLAQGRGLMKALPLLLAVTLLGTIPAVSLHSQTPSPADTALYGPYPTYYKEIVYNWLKTQLLDVDSAKIEWEGDPKPVDLGKDGQHLYGWLVSFNINARNRFGTYTGKQKHGALIRNGEVIKGLGFGY